MEFDDIFAPKELEHEEVVKKYNPFDLINDVSYDKNNLFENGGVNAQKAYDPFLTNKAMSYHQDTIMYAHEMNKCWRLSKKSQNDYYLNSIRKRKRWGKWAKFDNDEGLKIKAVMKFYNFGRNDALEAMSVLTKETIAYIIYCVKSMT